MSTIAGARLGWQIYLYIYIYKNIYYRFIIVKLVSSKRKRILQETYLQCYGMGCNGTSSWAHLCARDTEAHHHTTIHKREEFLILEAYLRDRGKNMGGFDHLLLAKWYPDVTHCKRPHKIHK